jgi:hypothetical protein
VFDLGRRLWVLGSSANIWDFTNFTPPKNVILSNYVISTIKIIRNYEGGLWVCSPANMGDLSDIYLDGTAKTKDLTTEN